VRDWRLWALALAAAVPLVGFRWAEWLAERWAKSGS
jgi:hypothetical protein